MIEVETLPMVSLMPVESDIWFLNIFTNRDYSIRVSKKPCKECSNKTYVKDKYETYCNHCGKIHKTRYYNYKTYNAFTHDMKVLKNRSTHLKTIETELKDIEANYNKTYRDFKHHYYDLFLKIADKDYHIDNGTANDLFYSMFRGFYDIHKSRGLRREKLVRRFLDRISSNPRKYFMIPVDEKLQQKILGKFKHIDITEDDDDGNNGQPGASRTPIISDGQLNVTGKVFSGRHISYQLFRKVNDYPDNTDIMFKYIKRYCKNYTLLEPNTHHTPTIWDKSSVAEPVTPVPVLNEDYVQFNGLGLKKKQPYTHTNLNTYTYTNIPRKTHTEEKTENPYTKNTENKTEIKTIGGTLMTERMNKHPYRDRIYQLKLTICKNCPKSTRLWITKKHRQYLCTCVNK